MSSRKRWRGRRAARPELEAQAYEVSADELFGVEMFAGPQRADTKTMQLCRQVEEAVSYALAVAQSALLRDLTVVAVEPVQGAAAVRVVVSTDQTRRDDAETLASLQRADGYLRGEVARAIHRKRVPALRFAVVPAVGSWATEDPDA